MLPAFRRAFEELIDPAQRSGGELRRNNGAVAPWVLGLATFYDQDVRPFAGLLAWELSRLGRFAAAEPLFDATHLMHPRDPDASLSFARCAAVLDHWPQVEAATSSTLAAVNREDPAFAEMRYLRALALARLGRGGEALRECEWVVAHAAPGSALQAAAAEEARGLRGGR